MKFILEEIPDSEMIIISDDKDIMDMKYLVKILGIQNIEILSRCLIFLV